MQFFQARRSPPPSLIQRPNVPINLCYKPQVEMRQLARLCPKENFKEPFGLPSVLAWVPRPKSWSPKLKFRGGALQAPKHFSWGAQAS